MKFGIEKKGYVKTEVDAYIAKSELAARKVQDEQLDRIRSLRKELDETTEKLSEFKKREKLISDALIVAVSKSEEIEKQAGKKYEEELNSLKVFHAKWLSYYNKIIAKYPVDDTIERAGDFNLSMAKILNRLDKPKLAPIEIKQSVLRANTEEAAPSASPTTTPEEIQYAEETERIGSARGINIAAVSSILEDAGMEDARYDRIAASWSKQLVPKELSDYLDVDPRTGVNAAALKGVGTNGFSFDEALNPTQELGDIMNDLGFDLTETSVSKKRRR